MTLSKAIRKLEASGLVVRASAALDGRAVTVQLSAKGRKLTQRVVVAVEQADDAFFGRLGKRELATYKALTAALVDGDRRSQG
jgi:DNA-binding MarR family transcriptional regulator